MAGSVFRTSIEIAYTVFRPYKQAIWKPFYNGFNRLHEKDYIFKSGSFAPKAQAILKLKQESTFKIVTYELEVFQDIKMVQAKAWLMLKFAEKCTINTLSGIRVIEMNPEKIEKLDFGRFWIAGSHGLKIIENKQTVEALYFGEHWLQLKVLQEFCSNLDFSDYHIEVLKHDPFHHVTFYRRNDLQLLEVAFVWCQHQLSKGKYEVKLKIEEN